MIGYVERKTPEMIRREAMEVIKTAARSIESEDSVPFRTVCVLVAAALAWGTADRAVKRAKTERRK